MNKTNDTDENIPDSNIDSEGIPKNPNELYILYIKIGCVISIILYIMILFSYFFFKNKKNFIMEIQLYFMTSVFLGSICLLFRKESFSYKFCNIIGTILYCIFTSQEVIALLIGLSCFLTMINRQYFSKRKIRFRIIFLIIGFIIPALISYFFVYKKELIGINNRIYCYLNFHIKNRLKPQYIILCFLIDCYILVINIYFICKIINLKDTTINKKLFSYVKWYPIINIIYKFFDAINIIYGIIRNEEKNNNYSIIFSILDAWHGIIYMIIYLCCSETSKGISYFFSHFIFCCCFKKKTKNTKVKHRNSINNLSAFNILNYNSNNNIMNGENLL